MCCEIYDEISESVEDLMESSTIATVVEKVIPLVENMVGGEINEENRQTLRDTVLGAPLSMMRLALMALLSGVVSAIMPEDQQPLWQDYFMRRTDREMGVDTEDNDPPQWLN